jgi:hypothetical protein
MNYPELPPYLIMLPSLNGDMHSKQPLSTYYLSLTIDGLLYRLTSPNLLPTFYKNRRGSQAANHLSLNLLPERYCLIQALSQILVDKWFRLLLGLA